MNSHRSGVLRRSATFLLVNLLLLLSLAAAVQAQFNYTIAENGVTITGYTGVGGDVLIPDTMEVLPVTAINTEAFMNRTSLFDAASSLTVYYLPRTTGWGETFAGRPTDLWIPIVPDLHSITSNTPLRLRSRSPASATLRVQRSTNLVDWEDWPTVSRDTGSSELRDSETSPRGYRFYRIQSPWWSCQPGPGL